VLNLNGWKCANGNVWPKIHEMHQTICNEVKFLKPTSILEVGAGSGMVAKYVYATLNGEVELTCLEGSSTHLKSMRENFTFGENGIIQPNINVKANIIEGFAQDIPLPDESIDFLYTCTLHVHLPFVASVMACTEYARVSKKFIMHVEGHHVASVPIENWISRLRYITVKLFPRLERLLRSNYDGLLIDYSRLYKILGYKTVYKKIFSDPYSDDYDYISILLEKEDT